MRNSFRLAIAQILVQGGELERNLARAEKSIRDAAGAGADVVLLPEVLDVGWTHPSVKSLADRVPGGETSNRIQRAASAAGVYVCAGLSEKANSGVIYNAAIFVNPSGKVLLHHRKIHELEIAHGLYGRGTDLQVVDTPLASFGVMICADAFAPGLGIGRALGLMGAQVILSPCAWAVDAGHDNTACPYGRLWIDSYAPVAREFRLWVASASNVGAIESGPWSGKKCIGNSLVVAPGGIVDWTGAHGIQAETCDIVTVVPEENRRLGDDPGAESSCNRSPEIPV